MLIIDDHAHVYPDESADKVISRFTEFHRMEPRQGVGKGTVGDLQDKMLAADMTYTVLANFSPLKNLTKTNEWTLKICRENKNLIPLVGVHPDMSLQEVKNYFAEGAKGIKMHNGIQEFDPCDPGLDKIWRFCEENRLPVTLHCGETSRVHMNEYTDMPRILSAVKKHPEVKFVLTHLAAGEPELVEMIAEKYRNVLFDTSIVLSGEHCIPRIHDDFWEDDEKAAAFFRKIGYDRFAFGSDYPFGNPVKDIERILKMNITDAEKRLLLGENTQALYLPD